MKRKSIVAQYDTDGSGEIEFPEFCNMMSNKMSQQDDAEMVTTIDDDDDDNHDNHDDE